MPAGVTTEMWPEVPPVGTLVEILVDVAELTGVRVILKEVLSLADAVSKLVPLTVTAVPEGPIVGVNPLIVGAAEVVTVKEVLLVTEPEGVVTLIGPLVAPGGTVATICTVVADVTFAEVPLKFTVFWPTVALKEVP